MVRIARAGLLAFVALLILATHGAAQTLPTGIAGTVRDATGAVIPGVTVEAASDALIEKVRTVVSDEHGEYKIIDLRSGTYTVTFSLPGFSTIKREADRTADGVHREDRRRHARRLARGDDHRSGVRARSSTCRTRRR